MAVNTGKRPIRVWNSQDWVTVLPTKQENRYRVIPDDGTEFVITASTDQEANDQIVKELRKQHPQGP